MSISFHAARQVPREVFRNQLGDAGTGLAARAFATATRLLAIARPVLADQS
jgi:hypothetical protein